MKNVVLSSLLIVGTCFSAMASAQTAVIGSLVSGQVSKVYVEEGQTVQKGQKLLTLDAQSYFAKEKALIAQLKISELLLQDATIERDQALDLFDRTVSSRRTLDAAKLAFATAEVQVVKDQAELDAHRSLAKYVFVKAPFNGKVTKLLVLEGSTVFEENTPMIEIER